MQIFYNLQEGEYKTNINVARALIEDKYLEIDDLKEIAEHLLVFVNNESNRMLKKNECCLKEGD